MKYLVTICKESIYTIEVLASDEDRAIQVAEDTFNMSPEFFRHHEDIIEAIDIKQIKE